MRIRVATALAAALAAVGMIAGAGVMACGNIATLRLEPEAGAPGTSVTVTGSSYWVRARAPVVVLRWNGVDGPELARGMPDSHGNIFFSVTLPPAPPGWYVLIAVQRDDRGADMYGTPTRANLQLLSPGQAVAPAPPVTVAIDRSDEDDPIPPGLAGVAAGALSAAAVGTAKARRAVRR